jgi:hypothetical protein
MTWVYTILEHALRRDGVLCSILSPPLSTSAISPNSVEAKHVCVVASVGHELIGFVIKV